MPECSKEERELLDAILTDGDVREARAKAILSRIDPDAFDALCQAKAQQYRGSMTFEALWKKLTQDVSLGSSHTLEVWWTSMEQRAKEIAGIILAALLLTQCASWPTKVTPIKWPCAGSGCEPLFLEVKR